MEQFYDAVVFDCDGVLVDSEVLSSTVSQRVLADLGWNVDFETMMATFVGCSNEFFVSEVEKNTGRTLAPDWSVPYWPWFEEAFREGLREIKGISVALDQIDLPTAVASNSGYERIRMSLEIVGLLDRFDGRICSAEDVAQGKPAPDVYLRAAELLCVAPERCIAIDDSAFGVQSARAAGMHVLAYETELTPPGAHSGPRTTVFHSMGEVPRLIDQLRRLGATAAA